MLHKLSKMLISLFSLQLQKCIQLDEKLKEMDREIAVNPQFVQKVCKNNNSTNTHKKQKK